MTVEQYRKAEDEYFRLKGQLAAGRITSEQFETALKDLMVQDDQGRYWMLGADSGKWYVHDGKNWVEAQPQGLESPPSVLATAPSSTKTRSGGLTVPIAIALVMLCLLGVVGLVLGANFGVLKISLGPFGGPTTTPTATITPFIAPTLTPTLTTTPLPTNTPLPPTLTPIPTATVIPSATLKPEGNCSDPNAHWDNVVDGQTVDPYATFIGTANAVNFTGYAIEWLRPGNVLYRSNTPVVHGSLFVWNTFTVPNGEYFVALIVVLNDGTTLAPCVVRVRVAH